MTLTYWRVWSNDYTPDFNAYQVNEEMEEKTNVKIEFTTVASSIAKEKFGILLASQDLPDMIENNVAYPGGGEGDQRRRLHRYGALCRDLYAELPRAAGIGRNRAEDDDLRYGQDVGHLPLFCDNDKTLCAEPSWIGMVIRQDWLDDLKLEQPHTIDEWHTVLTAFKEEKGAEAPLLLSKTGIMPYDYFLSSYGVKSEFLQGRRYREIRADRGGLPAVFELMAQWYAEGLVDQNFISNEITSNAPKDYIATENPAPRPIPGPARETTCTRRQQHGSGYQLAADYGPRAEGGRYVRPEMSAISQFKRRFQTTACEYPEIAAKWLDYQYTQDGFIANSFGDSECYTVDDGGNHAFTGQDYERRARDRTRRTSSSATAARISRGL